MLWRSNPQPNFSPESKLQTRARATSPVVRAHLVLILMLVLSACGNNRTRGVVLPMWHSLQGVQARVLLQLVDRWNQSNPDGIVVVPEYRPAMTMHAELVGTSTNTRTSVRNRERLPSLMLVSPMQAATYARENLLATLDKFVSDEASGASLSPPDISDLYPFVLNAGRTAQGNLIGAPMGGRVRMMLYNRDWLKSAGFDGPPTTWIQMSDMCNIAANSTRGTLCFAVAEDHTTLEDWLLASGTRLVSSDGSLMQANVPGALDVMNRLVQFLEQRQVYRVINTTKSREDFAAGLTPFAFDWSDAIDLYQADIKQRANFDWDATTLPGANGVGQPADVMYESNLWVVSSQPIGDSGPNRELASWKFMRWLLDTPQTVEWARTTGDLPARKSARAQLEENPVRATVLEQVTNGARPVPLLSGWGCVRKTMGSGIRNILDGHLVTETLRTVQLTAQSELGFDCALR